MSKINHQILPSWPEPAPPERFRHHHHQQTANINTASAASGPSQFLGTYGDMSLMEDCGLRGEKYGDMCDNYHKVHAKAGNAMDPRLFVLLEFFRELYLRRRDMFHRIFPGSHDHFQEMFRKIRSILLSGTSGQVNNNYNYRTLRRSLSVGSQRTRSLGGDELLTPERFKIKTVVPGSGGGAGAGGGVLQGGQGNVKSQD